MDFFVLKWDNHFVHYFDSIHWKQRLGFEAQTLNTYAFLISPWHDELKTYLELYKEAYQAQSHKKPVQFKRCMDKTQGITLYETGPFFFTVCFLKEENRNGRNDVVLDTVDQNNQQVYVVHDVSNKDITLTV